MNTHPFQLLVIALFAVPTAAQSIVANIQTTATQGLGLGSGVTDFIIAGNKAFFTATGWHGAELWCTDGTQAGTALVADIRPGTASSTPSNLTALGNRVIFAANELGTGTEVWASDGTAAGTTLLADIRPGPVSSGPGHFVEFGGLVYFAAADLANGDEIWKTDGTPAGTTLAFDLAPGTGSASPQHLTVIGNSLYFTASIVGVGRELYKSDGTLGGTQLVADIRPGSASSTPTDLAPFGNGLLFSAHDGTNGAEPWYSDGTTAGTVLLADLNPGPSGASAVAFTDLGNGRAVFRAAAPATGFEVYGTDGTPAGTGLLADSWPGTASGLLSQSFTAWQGEAWFTADNSVDGRELWRSDGTAAGTVMAVDIRVGPGNAQPDWITVVNNELWFEANDISNDREFWHSDGTPAGTSVLLDLGLNYSSSPQYLVAFGAGVLCSAIGVGTGQEPHFVDGTPLGSFLLANLPATPGTVMLFDARGGRSFPIAFAKDVLANTTDLLLREAPTNALRLEPVLPDGISGRVAVRIWDLDTGVGTTMPRPQDGGAWQMERLRAGWYRIEFSHPAFGTIDGGRHWVDGKAICDLGVVPLPAPAIVHLELGAGAAEPEPGVELYRIRDDLDVHVAVPRGATGEPQLLAPGDYALFWHDAAGTLRIERFTAEAGKTVEVRLPR